MQTAVACWDILCYRHPRLLKTGSRTEPMVKGGSGTTVVMEGSLGNCGMIVIIVQKIPKSTGVVLPTVYRWSFESSISLRNEPIHND